MAVNTLSSIGVRSKLSRLECLVARGSIGLNPGIVRISAGYPKRIERKSRLSETLKWGIVEDKKLRVVTDSDSRARIESHSGKEVRIENKERGVTCLTIKPVRPLDRKDK
jgi:hypothetical protein